MKKLIFVFVAALLVSGAVFAQNRSVLGNEPEGFIASPTATATAGRFTSDVDDYISAADYAGVEFQNWFGFASFANNQRGTLGYARRFGGVYVGLYYGGNFLTGYAPENYTESDVTNGTKKTIRNYRETYDFVTGNYNNNRFAVLIGVGDMGFRLSYASNHDSFHKEDLQLEGGEAGYYKSYDSAIGMIQPQIQWGMTKTLLDNGIQPLVTLDLGFQRNFTRYEGYGTAWATNGEWVDNSQNYFQPRLSLGLGGFTFYTGENFSVAADLDYALTLRFYNNDYSYMDTNGKNQIKSIKGLNAGGTTGLSENSYMHNMVSPSIKADYLGNERLGLSAKLSLPLGFRSEKSAHMILKTDNTGDLQKNGTDVAGTADSSTLTFTFAPQLDLGFQYQILPGKFTLSGGGILYTNISIANRESADYAAGVKVTDSDGKHRTASYGTFDTGLYAGFSFNFNEHFGLEAMTGINGNDTTDNTVNIFGTDTGNIATFGSILASLKF